VDSAVVELWDTADPAEPGKAPRTTRYAAVGTANAEVTLWIAGLDGSRTEARWDRGAFEYVPGAGWDAQGPYAVVQSSRDQCTVRFLGIDPVGGETRVLIRGWSFGGSLAALAVLRRPDVFHAAVAGAGVTDQLLCNAYWRERFLGHPDKFPERYEACSLVLAAPKLTRPLLLIHGLADDNVYPANTARRSAARTTRPVSWPP
jgi:pimeloyl-ACP methyl ester carboxylesterase